MDIFSSLLSGSALTVLAIGVALDLVSTRLRGSGERLPDLRIRLLDQAQTLNDYHNTLLEIERKHALALQDKEASSEIQIHRR